jgi:hypothetical protein
MDFTDRTGMPLLAAGQTQKETYHNEALTVADLLICGVVTAPSAGSPPATPESGILYQVPAAATGAWSGQDGQLSAYTQGGWRFVAPFEGLRLTQREGGIERRWTGTGWEVGQTRTNEVLVGGQKVVGSRVAAIAAPAGGTTVDAEARNCLSAMLDALKAHGLVET